MRLAALYIIATPILLAIISLAGCVNQPTSTALRSNNIRPLEQQLKVQARQLQQLSTTVEQLSNALVKNQQQLTELRHTVDQFDQQHKKIPNKSITVQPQDQQPTVMLPPQPTATELYLRGFSAYTGTNYKLATESFNEFIKKYPANSYVPNAYFWLGESYVALGLLQPATMAYNTIVTKFDNSNKAPDALLKMAQIYVQLKQNQQAEKLFLKLQQRYPDSSAVRNIPASLL